MHDATATFWGHAIELRRTFIQIVSVILLGIVLSFVFCQTILSWFTFPLEMSSQDGLLHQEVIRERIINPESVEKSVTIDSTEYSIPPGGSLDVERTFPKKGKLVILGPLDGVFAAFKVSFWTGLVGTSPLWLLIFLKFLIPALYSHEMRLIGPFLILSLLFLSGGFFFAYFVTIPLANEYLQLFNEGFGINLWSLTNYIDYTVTLLLSNALAFECAVILLFLVHFGILSAEALKSKRRHAIVAAFIIGAVFTPPDVLTQLMLAIPLIGLYEMAIVYAKMRSYLTRMCSKSRLSCSSR